MNSKQPQKAIRMTRVNVDAITRDNPERNAEIRFTYAELQDARKRRTEKFRQARIAAADYQAEESKVQALESKFQAQVATVSEKVASEPIWMPPFLDGNGELCIESPYTMKDMRNAARLAHKQMEQAAEREDIDPDSLMETDEDEQ